MYDKTTYKAYTSISEYRDYLKSSDTILNVTDLGAGSKRLPTTKRHVKRMVRQSSSSIRQAKLLYCVSKYFKIKSALELGTSLGMATHAMSLGMPGNNLITIDGCPNTSDFAKATHKVFGIDSVTFLKGDFTSLIPTLQNDTFDLVFFDGHHQKQATLNYFEKLLPKAHNNSVFIFDDIYWSKGMTEAWEQIKKHPQVRVTVDTFHLGFIFFRQEQQKEHFRIRS
ncbi:class I SAM-dependent methyltransferase [Winogradskyella maritima]|nr:class I SAM-dependent methyltransferase [Winogradskyella maritima]